MNIFKNILNVALTNIVSFGTSFLVSFILPLILSVTDYGNYRQYLLYMSFTYMFNFGFNDGIYIKYGGKEMHELNRREVIEEHNFVFLFQLVIFMLMFSYSIWQKSIVFGIFSVATFFNSINGYHENFMQAIGEFTFFSRSSIAKSFFNIILLVLAIFVFKFDSYISYIIIHVLAIVFLFIIFEFYFVNKNGMELTFSITGKPKIIKIGIFVLIANMSLAFVGNVGSWIVNLRYPIEYFAQYSFQNSVLNVILLIVNAVSLVFYNIISKRRNKRILNIIKYSSIYLGIGSGLAFFVFKYIIQIFLPDYSMSVNLLSITFISIPYIMTSKILIGNLYKTTTTEYKYFMDSIIYAIGAFGLVFVTDLIFNNMTAIAFSTTICYILWFIYTTNIKFDYLKSSKKESFLLISHFVIFIVTANYLSTLLGLIIYLAYIFLAILFNKNQLIQIYNVIKDKS